MSASNIIRSLKPLLLGKTQHNILLRHNLLPALRTFSVSQHDLKERKRYPEEDIPEEDKDKLIKFSTSSIHPSKFKLRQTKVLTEDNEEDRKLQKRRHRVLAWGVFLPIFLYYVYTIYFKETVIDLEIEDKVEGVFPGYILRRMAKDAEYKEKMILLRPQLEEEFEKFMKEQKE